MPAEQGNPPGSSGIIFLEPRSPRPTQFLPPILLAMPRPLHLLSIFALGAGLISYAAAEEKPPTSEQEQFFENKLSPYQGMTQLLIAQNNTGEALAYAERAKARVLLDVDIELRAPCTGTHRLLGRGFGGGQVAGAAPRSGALHLYQPPWPT